MHAFGQWEEARVPGENSSLHGENKGQSQQMAEFLPEEGVLFSVHPGLQLEGGVLPKRRSNEAEEQRDQHEQSRQNNL